MIAFENRVFLCIKDALLRLLGHIVLQNELRFLFPLFVLFFLHDARTVADLVLGSVCEPRNVFQCMKNMSLTGRSLRIYGNTSCNDFFMFCDKPNLRKGQFF